MKVIVLFLFILLILGTVSAFAAGVNQPFNPDDVNAIKLACLDYVQGYYESNTDRVTQGVHPSLVKRNIKNDAIVEMSRDQLLAATQKSKKSIPEITVDVYDVCGNIASAKVTSGFVDYTQLAKINNHWQVINVLWTNLPSK